MARCETTTWLWPELLCHETNIKKHEKRKRIGKSWREVRGSMPWRGEYRSTLELTYRIAPKVAARPTRRNLISQRMCSCALRMVCSRLARTMTETRSRNMAEGAPPGPSKICPAGNCRVAGTGLARRYNEMMRTMDASRMNPVE